MTECVKVLDNDLLQKYDVKLYGSNHTIYDIINDLSDNQGDEPFYIIDLSEIIDAYNKWIIHLPLIKPFYAVKCNNNTALLEVLSNIGCNFDCASRNELKMIMEITKDSSRIVFANPIKSSSEIKFARANDVDLMTFDSEYELYKIKLYHPYAQLILRIAVDDSKSICKFNKKFGCKLTQVEEILKLAKMLNLGIVGISFHVGSGCCDSMKFYEAIRDCRTAYDIAQKNNIVMSIIDVGGGFVQDSKKAKFEDVADCLNKGINEFFSVELKNEKIKFIGEPGRFMAQKSHTLVLNIIGKKIEIDEIGEKYIIYYLNDGVYGSFSCKIFDYRDDIVILPFNERDGKLYKSTFFGRTCDSFDIIQENVMFPELTIGETAFVSDFGAYTVSASSSFNGFKTTINKYIYRS